MTAKSSGAITWTGKNDAGSPVADGAYTFRVHGRDRAGNPVVRDVDLKVDRTLRAVGRTPSRFYPQDGDRLKPSTRMAYTLTRSAHATLEILRGSTVVRTVYRDRSLARGDLRLDVERPERRRRFRVPRLVHAPPQRDEHDRRRRS